MNPMNNKQDKDALAKIKKILQENKELKIRISKKEFALNKAEPIVRREGPGQGGLDSILGYQISCTSDTEIGANPIVFSFNPLNLQSQAIFFDMVDLIKHAENNKTLKYVTPSPLVEADDDAIKALADSEGFIFINKKVSSEIEEDNPNFLPPQKEIFQQMCTALSEPDKNYDDIKGLYINVRNAYSQKNKEGKKWTTVDEQLKNAFDIFIEKNHTTTKLSRAIHISNMNSIIASAEIISRELAKEKEDAAKFLLLALAVVLLAAALYFLGPVALLKIAATNSKFTHLLNTISGAAGQITQWAEIVLGSASAAASLFQAYSLVHAWWRQSIVNDARIYAIGIKERLLSEVKIPNKGHPLGPSSFSLKP